MILLEKMHSLNQRLSSKLPCGFQQSPPKLAFRWERPEDAMWKPRSFATKCRGTREMSRARGAENLVGQHYAEHPSREESKEVQRNHEARSRIGVKKLAENYVRLHPQT